MRVHYTDNSFSSLAVNPYNSNRPYTDEWIMIKVIEEASFKLYTGGGIGGIFQLVITKQNTDWAYKLHDFLQYETSYAKNIIAAVNEPDLLIANNIYGDHTFTDAFIRPYEQRILMHTTSGESFRRILHDGYIKSWSLLKREGSISEDKPIGSLLGDPPDYSDFIMFSNGGISTERVISSRQKGRIDMGLDVPYIAGARLYFDAEKIANAGLLTRDGAHLKVKEKLKLDDYLLWASTPQMLGIDAETTPRIFATRSDEAFQSMFGISLPSDTRT